MKTKNEIGYYGNPERDKNVQMRNGILLILVEGVKRGNDGDTSYIKRALKRISAMESYSVYIVKEQTLIEGETYSADDKVIQIKENDYTIFTIYKDKKCKDGLTVVHVSTYDLMTKKEIDEYLDRDISGELDRIAKLNSKFIKHS